MIFFENRAHFSGSWYSCLTMIFSENRAHFSGSWYSCLTMIFSENRAHFSGSWSKSRPNPQSQYGEQAQAPHQQEDMQRRPQAMIAEGRRQDQQCGAEDQEGQEH